MTAQIYILPIVPRVSPQDPDWCEQYERTLEAVVDAMREPPPRTRPLVVYQLPERSK